MGIRFVRSAIVAAAVLSAGASVTPATAGQPQPLSHDRWSGFYVGGSLGYHAVHTAGIFDGVEPAGTPDLANIGGDGLNLGVAAGYDWQWNHLVAGVEADASWGGFSRSYTTIQDGSVTEAGLLSYPIVGDLAYLATLRGRLGFHSTLPGGHDALFYVTGGAAFTQFDMDVADGRSKVAFDAVGTVVGGGVELALNDRSSIRAEYLHHTFGKQLDIADVGTSGVFDANDGNFVRLDSVDIFRVGWDVKLK
jgi:outer membrane immunogenic protein